MQAWNVCHALKSAWLASASAVPPWKAPTAFRNFTLGSIQPHSCLGASPLDVLKQSVISCSKWALLHYGL